MRRALPPGSGGGPPHPPPGWSCVQNTKYTTFGPRHGQQQHVKKGGPVSGRAGQVVVDGGVWVYPLPGCTQVGGWIAVRWLLCRRGRAVTLWTPSPTTYTSPQPRDRDNPRELGDTALACIEFQWTSAVNTRCSLGTFGIWPKVVWVGSWGWGWGEEMEREGDYSDPGEWIPPEKPHLEGVGLVVRAGFGGVGRACGARGACDAGGACGDRGASGASRACGARRACGASGSAGSAGALGPVSQ
eukprot:gene7682-biopygen19576